MKAKYILLLNGIFGIHIGYSQNAFLVRQTLSSDGTSSTYNSAESTLIVQQSIGQASVAGKSGSENTRLHQGFIQAPFMNQIFIAPQDLNITSYPNPVSDELTIDFSSETLQEALVEIVDISGKELLTKPAENLSFQPLIQIRISDLSTGAYFLRVIADSRVFTSQFIKP